MIKTKSFLSILNVLGTQAPSMFGRYEALVRQGYTFWTDIIGTNLQGAQWFMVLYGLAVFLQSERANRSGRGRFIVISWIILLVSSTGQISGNWISFASLTYPEGLHGAFLLVSSVDGIAKSLTMFIADILMVWRCMVIWQYNRWVLYPLLLASLASLGLDLFSIFRVMSDYASSRASDDFQMSAYLGVPSGTLRVGNHVVSSALILFQLSATRRTMVEAFPGRKQSGMYSRAAALVIESAAPLTIFGICHVVAAIVITSRIKDNPVSLETLEPRQVWIVYAVFFRLYESGSALLPQMIIFRVNMGHSWTSRDDSHGGLATFSQPIAFAHTRGPTDECEDAVELHLSRTPSSQGAGGS